MLKDFMKLKRKTTVHITTVAGVEKEFYIHDIRLDDNGLAIIDKNKNEININEIERID